MYGIREVTITFSYNGTTDPSAIADAILDITGVEGTFVPAQERD